MIAGRLCALGVRLYVKLESTGWATVKAAGPSSELMNTFELLVMTDGMSPQTHKFPGYSSGGSNPTNKNCIREIKVFHPTVLMPFAVSLTVSPPEYTVVLVTASVWPSPISYTWAAAGLDWIKSVP